MKERGLGHTASILSNGTLIVTGGANGTAQNSVESYNPVTRNWTKLPNMARGRSCHTAAVAADGRIFLAGGGTGITLKSYEFY